MTTNQAEQVEQFRNLGMTVLFIEEAGSVPGVLDSVRLFGELTGNEDRAEALAEELGGRIDAVTAELADLDGRPRVFFELDGSLFTVGTDTFVGDLLTLLGAANVAAGATSPFPQLTAEAVIAADPEVVLLADAEFGESAETVCARPGWSAVSACASGRVHAVDPDLTNRPGPRVVDGLEAIARLLYPERFAP
jgi:iron complex transport system substrate-binding protein